MNLRDSVESRVERNPGKPFLYYEKEVISYGAFDQKINQGAKAYPQAGDYETL